MARLGVRGLELASCARAASRASNHSPLFVALLSLLAKHIFTDLLARSPTRSPQHNTTTPSETPQGEDARP